MNVATADSEINDRLNWPASLSLCEKRVNYLSFLDEENSANFPDTQDDSSTGHFFIAVFWQCIKLENLEGE